LRQRCMVTVNGSSIRLRLRPYAWRIALIVSVRAIELR
jgi:hypothetical protein